MMMNKRPEECTIDRCHDFYISHKTDPDDAEKLWGFFDYCYADNVGCLIMAYCPKEIIKLNEQPWYQEHLDKIDVMLCGECRRRLE